MRNFIVSIICMSAVLVISSGCNQNRYPLAEPQPVTFVTSDNVTIYADYYAQDHPAPVLILLHMYGENRTSWEPALPDWYGRGFAVVALDMRGHGKSRTQGDKQITFDHRSTGKALFRHAWRDVAAAVNHFESYKYAQVVRTVLVGASIGCTVAIDAGGRLDYVRGLALISPGENYLGIDSVSDIKQLKSKPLLMISDEKEAPACETLLKAGGYSTAFHIVFPNAGHGTRMFDSTSGPRIIHKIGSWLEKRFL